MSDVKFSDMTGRVYNIHPIQRAASLDGAHKKEQLQKHGKETFVDCPGIFDYKNTGWIMPAWDEFKIYASENATMAYAGCEQRSSQLPMPSAMSSDITDGIPKSHSGCPVKRLQPLHFTSPWRIDTEKDISLLLLPPAYHSDIVNEILIYPGVVDYNSKFGTINVILSPKREGTFVIKAGTPLLHIIPITKREYNATYGKTKNKEHLGVVANAKQFYRRYIMKRSKYNLTLDE